MKRISVYSEDGSVSVFALAAVISLSAVLISVLSVVSSSSRKTESYRRRLERERNLEKLILSIESDFQKTTEDPNDRRSSPNIEWFTDKYREYDISCSDVSTGINEKLFSKDFLREKNISDLLFHDGEGIKSSYGWINPKYADDSLIREILKEHGAKDAGDVFPVFSRMPYCNVFNMSDSFIKALINHFEISDAESKLVLLHKMLNENENVSRSMIADALSVPSNHQILDFLGVKTVFWSIKFRYDDEETELIVAAVPYRYERTDEVEKYTVIEKRSAAGRTYA